MVSKHVTTNCFLGLDLCSAVDDTLGSIEDTNIEHARHGTNQTLNVDKQTRDDEDASHSGDEAHSTDLDREWASLITEHAESCKNCGGIDLIKSKKGFELVDARTCNWCCKTFTKKIKYGAKKKKP